MANWGQWLWGLYPWGGGLTVTADATLQAGHDTVKATAYVEILAVVDVTSPAHTVEVLTGNNVSVTSPAHTVEVTAIVSVIASVDVTQPHGAISSSSIDNVLATVDVTSPMHLPAGVLNEFVSAVVNVTSHMPYVDSQAYHGIRAIVEVTSPVHTVESIESVVPVATINSTMPMHSVEVMAIVEAAISFTGIVVNTENFGNTVYAQYPFNSFCLFNGVYFGCTAAGVYSLTGDDDDGADIDAVAKTGTVDIGKPSKVVPRKAYLTGRFKGMKIRIYPGEGDPYTQEIKENGDGPREAEVKFGRGHKERYFAWEILNRDGADFEIDSFNIQGERKSATPLRRR